MSKVDEYLSRLNSTCHAIGKEPPQSFISHIDNYEKATKGILCPYLFIGIFDCVKAHFDIVIRILRILFN
jgi:hypothetical protein